MKQPPQQVLINMVKIKNLTFNKGLQPLVQL